jgi:membrane protein required for beta-lactamase induction
VNFLALLLGLGVERLLTHLFHLREFRWLDPLFDRLFRMLAKSPRWAVILGVILFTVVVAAPVALVSVALAGTLFQIPYFVLAVIVLLFSLGPRDLKEEVNDYCLAVENGSEEDVKKVVRELIEDDAPEESEERSRLVERAIFVQANNRIFGVVFWFLLLGPTGAWLFRILDLMRRRLTFRYSRHHEEQEDAELVAVVRSLHGIFAWLPARLLAAGYALAGSFEGSRVAWRKYHVSESQPFFDVTNDIMVCIGHGAAGHRPEVVV